MRPNDLFAQFLKHMYFVNEASQQDIDARRHELETCNHLFLELVPSRYEGACHSSDCYTVPSIVECVHCGLTNKFMAFDNSVTFDGSGRTRKFFADFPPAYFWKEKLTIESQVCRKENLDAFEKLSKEALMTFHPQVLYQLAKQIMPDASNQELFDIMKQLTILETSSEQIYLATVEQAEDLKARYIQNNHVKVPIKKR